MVSAGESVLAGARAGEWLGFPKGAWLIIGIEFWERFSFYGMLSILVLFLTAAPARGGFGWSATEALSLLGAYSFAMYAFPAMGGFFADRVLGRRRAVTVGATCMLVGQLMLSAPVFLPELLGWWHGVPLLGALRELGEPLGRWGHSSALEGAIARQGALLDAGREGGLADFADTASRTGVVWLRQAYVAASVGFFLSLCCLVLGNALMKSTLVVLCGETLSINDPRREAAYAYYYLGISLGAMLSGIAVGWAADAFGWHMGFALAAAGMAVALGAYLLLAGRWLGDIGSRPDLPLPGRAALEGGGAPSGSAMSSGSAAAGGGAAPAGVEQARREVWRRIGLLAVLAALLCAFSVGWFQLFGSWLLFLELDVDRTIGSFVIPVPWFTSMNAAVVIVLAPLVAALWVRLGARKQRLDIVQKYAFALSMVAGGHMLMYLAARHATQTAPAPLWIPVLALSMLALGELVAWTATYGMVSRAAPAGFASVAMGAWYLLTLGLGGYLSGFTGRLIDATGFSTAFAAVTILMSVAFVMAVALRRPLHRLAARARVTL